MINRPLAVALVVLTLSAAQPGFAQSPAEIFSQMDKHKQASIAEIDDMTRLKSMAGVCALEYFEKESTQSTDGRGTIEYMRLVPITEVSERNSAGSPIATMSADDLDAAADTMRNAGAQMSDAFRSEAANSGLPGGIGTMLMNPPADQPWLSADPDDMGQMYATMFEGAAASKRHDAAERLRAEQEAGKDPYAAVASQTRVTGRETLHGRPAIKLITENLNNRQTTDGGEFVIETMHLWVDADRYVPLKMQADGIATQNGESRAVSIGREDLDFQSYPGCGSLLEPSKSILRMSGILTPEEEAQMAEASAQIAEFEQQLASMPAAQKEMIMRQMGPQIEMMRNLAAGNGIEMITEVKAMRCNTGTPANEEYIVSLPVNMGMGCDSFQTPGTGFGGAGSSGAGAAAAAAAPGSSAPPPASSAGSSPDAASADTDLVRMIQLDLQRLGFDPGNTDGVLSRETVIAITQFESANGLEVTGRAIPQLAGRLQAAVGALN